MGILSELIKGGIESAQQIAQNTFNSQEAQKNRDFQEEMSNTAFQRQVLDMQKAGLNPALMYGSGSNGASSPSGSTASAAGGFDIVQAMMADKQMKLMDAQYAKTMEEANLVSREAAWKDKLSDAEFREIESRIGVNSAQVNSMEYDNALKKSQELLNQGTLKWLDELSEAQIASMNAKTASDMANAAIAQFELQSGHRLTSSEWLAFADTMAALFKNNKEAVDTILGKISDKVESTGKSARRFGRSFLRGTELIDRWSRDHSLGGGGR